MLTDSDLGFALLRQHQAFRESENISVMVFREETEALAWLGADAD